MIESVMRQQMHSWLKDKCLIDGVQMILLSSAMTKMHDDLNIQLDPESFEPYISRTLLQLIKMRNDNIITDTLENKWREMVHDIFDRYKYYMDVQEWNLSIDNVPEKYGEKKLTQEEDLSNIIDDMERFMSEVHVSTLEKVVECECGKHKI